MASIKKGAWKRVNLRGEVRREMRGENCVDKSREEGVMCSEDIQSKVRHKSAGRKSAENTELRGASPTEHRTAGRQVWLKIQSWIRA